MRPGVEGRFWRLHTGAEVDYVELEGAGGIRGCEFKLSPEARAKEPASWRSAYPAATWDRIDRSNYPDFVGQP